MSDNEKTGLDKRAMTLDDALNMFSRPIGSLEQTSLSLMESVADLDKEKLDDITKSSPGLRHLIQMIQAHNSAKGEKQIQAQQIAQYLKENEIDPVELKSLLQLGFKS